jgi:hypothetical protein
MIYQQINHFGNDCNVMAEVLISRYIAVRGK